MFFWNTIVNEYPAQFLVNLHDYIDTGLFLDYRKIRQNLTLISRDHNILNLFSYTATASVIAALSGGTTTNVDWSNTYQDWAKKNFDLNHIDIKNHNFIRSHVNDFLKHDTSKYDIILLDPPTFSNSKKRGPAFDIEKEHIKLIELTMNRLKKTGTLFFSHHKKKFQINKSALSFFDINETTNWSIPEDFHSKTIHKSYKIRHKKA